MSKSNSIQKDDVNRYAFYILTNEETELLELIRNQAYQSVTITKKDGAIRLIEVKEHIDNQKRIIDILKQHNYQSVEIKKVDGKIVHINRVIQKKLNVGNKSAESTK